MYQEKFENKTLYECKCHTHAITIEKFEYDDEDNEVNIFFWYSPGRNDLNFFKKLKAAYEIFKYGKCLLQDIILSKKNAKELGEELIKVSEEGGND